MVKLPYNFVLEFLSPKRLCIYATPGCDEVLYMYIGHLKFDNQKNQNRRAYNQRVVEVEHGSFTPLVLSATGGIGTAASICYTTNELQ